MCSRSRAFNACVARKSSALTAPSLQPSASPTSRYWSPSIRDSRSAARWHVATDSFEIFADRDQLYRVIANIALNALQAGATWIEVEAQRHNDRIEI